VRLRRGRLVKVRDRMTSEVITVAIDEPIRRVWDLAMEKRLRRFPVMDGERLVGIITDRDLRNATASSIVMTEKKYHDFLLDTVKVDTIMTVNPRTISPESDIKEAGRVILEMQVGGLPVLEGDVLAGIITETDLIKTLLDLLPDD
jgi:acetoin utilization protein AcuB